MFCPKCGKETDALGKFCQWCGEDIVANPVTPSATPEEEEADVVWGGGVEMVVSRGLISACVGLVQPAASAQRTRQSVANRIRGHFMKNALIYFIFLICALQWS